MFCEFTKTISFILLLKKVRSLEGNERVYGAFVKNWQDFRFLLVSQFPSKSKIFCEFTNTISSQFAFKCWHSESAWVQFLSGTKKFCEFAKTISFILLKIVWSLKDNVYMGASVKNWQDFRFFLVQFRQSLKYFVCLQKLFLWMN